HGGRDRAVGGRKGRNASDYVARRRPLVATPGRAHTRNEGTSARTKEVSMPTYVTLIHYTEQGVKTFKDLKSRLEETRRAGEPVGAKLNAFYLTMGQYDAVVVSEAPDDATVAKLALAAAGRGNVRTETLRAFTEDEALRISEEL